MLACVRSLAKICSAEPRPGLAFIEAIQPVGDRKLVAELDAMLDDVLLGRVDAPVSLAIPADLAAHLPCVASYNIRVGSAQLTGRSALDLQDLLYRVRVQHAAAPTKALRAGRVELCGDAGGADPLAGAPAIRWIETCLSRDARRYFLIEGAWHESGVEYLGSIRRQVADLLAKPPSIALPPWRKGEHERQYNIRAQHELGRDRFLCLDRTSVRTRLHKGNGIEVCDGYGPAGELICIKPASGSPALSHLVNQALNATEALVNQPEARQNFSELVAGASGGTRSFPAGGHPGKVIFGIHLKNGRTLTPDTLFPFAQVALVNMAITLRAQYRIDVEVIGIPPE